MPSSKTDKEVNDMQDYYMQDYIESLDDAEERYQEDLMFLMALPIAETMISTKHTANAQDQEDEEYDSRNIDD